ncbi:hypothetical protein G6F63_015448 [Rhizopus arrhizus]|nr:hypothetical protein G6F63_015448 [Rhizopus arrhizus]
MPANMTRPAADSSGEPNRALNSAMMNRPRAWIRWYITPVCQTARSSGVSMRLSPCAPKAPAPTATMRFNAASIVSCRSVIACPCL